MKPNNKTIMAWVLGLGLVLSGCGPSQLLGSTLAPTLRPTLIPTTTPTSTSTPTSTFIPTSTSTPKPTYTPLAPDLPSVKRVLYSDSFDILSKSYWQANGNTAITNGHLIIKAPGSIVYTPDFQEGHGYLLLFRAEPLTTFLMICDYGPWGDSSYRGFMLINGGLFAIYTGSNVVQKDINFKYKPQIWYYALIWLTPESAQGKIWEKDHPENNQSFSIDRNGFLIQHALNYWVNILNKGSIEIDEFQELEFSK